MIFTATGVDLGLVTLRYYGVILAAAGVIAALLTGRMYRHLYPGDSSVQGYAWAWDALLWVLVPGLLGARIYHVLFPSLSSLAVGVDRAFFIKHPYEILNFWQGGLGMPGAISGAGMGLFVYSRRNGIPFSRLLDSVLPGAALGVILLSAANHINQAGYGPPADLPWCTVIRPENRLPGFEMRACYHPLYFYLAAWDFLAAVFSFLVFRRWKSRLLPGDLSVFYLFLFSLGRFTAGFFRMDYSPLMEANLDQLFMLGLFIGSVLILLIRRGRLPGANRTVNASGLDTIQE